MIKEVEIHHKWGGSIREYIEWTKVLMVAKLVEQSHICIIWILINIYLPVHLHKIISSGALMSMKIVTFATNVTVIIPWSQWKNKPTTGRKYPHPQYSQVNTLCPDNVTLVACFTSLELKYELTTDELHCSLKISLK